MTGRSDYLHHRPRAHRAPSDRETDQTMADRNANIIVTLRSNADAETRKLTSSFREMIQQARTAGASQAAGRAQGPQPRPGAGPACGGQRPGRPGRARAERGAQPG